MPEWDFEHVRNNVNPHILRMFEDTFHLTRSKWNIFVCGKVLRPNQPSGGHVDRGQFT